MNEHTSSIREILSNLHELSGANPRHAFGLAEMESWGYEQSDLIAILNRLSDAGLIRLSSVTEDGIPLKTYITPDGIQKVESGARKLTDSSSNSADDSLLVFISHSSRDKDVAVSLIDLLMASLHLRSSDIRCTSVDGYRLPAGTSDQVTIVV